jgi:6-phosphogluconolactonase
MRLTRRSWLVSLSLPFAVRAQEAKGEFLMYVGTYTREDSKGIYVWRFNATTGELTSAGLAAETPNPSFLAVHPNRRVLYAANEIGDYEGQRAGSVSAFSIDRASGRLTLLNRASTRGSGPCYVTLDRTGKAVLAANYGGGSVASFPVGDDGRLGEAASFIQHTGSSVHPQRQRGPHAHSINVSPDNRFAIAADLGLDQLLIYRLDPAKATLTPHEPPFVRVAPGSGPRHFAFHPSGRFAYVINELLCTVTAFAYDAKGGVLKEIQTISTLPADFTRDNTISTAEVVAHPNGRFLYGSNRGHNTIGVFAVDTGKGTLTPVEHVATQGQTPRNFALDPTGNWLFAENQQSNTIVLFRLDRKTGRLTSANQTLQITSPVCVRFVALG